MSHFDFASESGVWSREMVPGAQHYYRWDINQSKLLSSAGGAYAPTAPIIIGGAGLRLNSPGDRIIGGVRTQTGGRLILGQQDVPLLNQRTKRLVYSLLTVKPNALGVGQTVQSPGGNAYSPFPDAYHLKALPPFPTGIVSSSHGFQIPIPKSYLVSRGVRPLDGVLSRLTLTYRVITKPAKVAAPGLASPFLQIFSGSGPWVIAGSPPSTSPLGPASIFNSGFNTVPMGGVWRGPGTVTEGAYLLLEAGTPNGPQILGFYFKATTGGVNGTSPPTFNLTPGSTTQDGAVTWTCVGGTGWPVLPGANVTGGGDINDWYNGGNAQTVEIDFDTSVQQNCLDTADQYYIVQINPPTDPTTGLVVPLILHSLTFDFENLVSMSWR